MTENEKENETSEEEKSTDGNESSSESDLDKFLEKYDEDSDLLKEGLRLKTWDEIKDTITTKFTREKPPRKKT